MDQGEAQPEMADGIDTRIIPPRYRMKSSHWIALNRAGAHTVLDQCLSHLFCAWTQHGDVQVRLL